MQDPGVRFSALVLLFLFRRPLLQFADSAMPRSEHWMSSRNTARLKWGRSQHEQSSNRPPTAFRNQQRSHSCDTVTAILRSAGHGDAVFLHLLRA